MLIINFVVAAAGRNGVTDMHKATIGEGHRIGIHIPRCACRPGNGVVRPVQPEAGSVDQHRAMYQGIVAGADGRQA